MRHIYNFFYLLCQGFIGIFRNSIMTTASILVLVCCMLIVGTFGLVIKAVDASLDEINDLNVIVAYIDKTASGEEIRQMKAQIESFGDNVTVTFVDKNEGMEKFKEQLGDVLDIYLSGERINPLPDCFEVSFSSAESAEGLNNSIRKLDKITETRHKIGLVEKFDNAKRGITSVVSLLLAILLIVALFVIMNTIKLGVFARRDEIAVMRYVGATGIFIITPFLVEGVLIGIISAGLSYGAQYLLYANVLTDIIDSYGIGPLQPFSQSALTIAVLFLGIGFFSGTVGAGISVKKYLSE